MVIFGLLTITTDPGIKHQHLLKIGEMLPLARMGQIYLPQIGQKMVVFGLLMDQA
jgi:hypothetical protein